MSSSSHDPPPPGKPGAPPSDPDTAPTTQPSTRAAAAPRSPRAKRHRLLRLAPPAPSSPARPLPILEAHLRAVLHLLGEAGPSGATLAALALLLADPGFGRLTTAETSAALAHLVSTGRTIERAGKFFIVAPEPTREASTAAPDAVALGFTRSCSWADGAAVGGRSAAELYLYALDGLGMTQPDPAGAILHQAGEWLALLIACVVSEDLEINDLEARLDDVRRQLVAGLELHRRQRDALLQALAAGRAS